MAIDHDPSQNFAPLDQEDDDHLQKYETLRTFKGSSAPEILARLEWYDQRSLSQLVVLLHNIGLTPLQTLVVVEAFDQQQTDYSDFIRAGLDMEDGEEAADQHPAQEPLELVLNQVTETLEAQLDEAEQDTLFDETLRQGGLRGMGNGDLIQLLCDISNSFKS